MLRMLLGEGCQPDGTHFVFLILKYGPLSQKFGVSLIRLGSLTVRIFGRGEPVRSSATLKVGWVKQTAAGVGIHLKKGWLIEPR